MRFSGTVTLQYDTPFSPFPASEYEQGLDWLAVEGFDGAELCISDYRALDIGRIKEKLDHRKLACSTISTGQSRTKEGISLLHEGQALKQAQERMRQHIDAAALFGSCVTLGLLRGIGTPGDERHETSVLARNIDPVVDYAEQRGVTVIMEGINRYETCLFNSIDVLMDFIEDELKSPASVGVLWDIFHANIEDRDFAAAIDRAGPRLRHVHIADSNRWFPGHGHIDFKSIVRLLRGSGFDGYLSYECFNLPSVEYVRREAGRFVLMLRELN